MIVELAPQQVTQGIRDADWPIDPEGIARHLRLMDRIEPLEFTPEEEVALQAARKAQKDCDIANFEVIAHPKRWSHCPSGRPRPTRDTIPPGESDAILLFL